MLKLHSRAVSRTYQCDMPGCRNRTNILWSRRADVSSRPVHLCNDCIKGLYEERFKEEAAPEVPTLAPDGGVELNGGLETVAAIPEEDPGEPESEPKEEAQKQEPKKPDAPKAARKPAGGAKTGGKARTGGKA